MDAIQRLRSKAQANGKLATTKRQKVAPFKDLLAFAQRSAWTISSG
jgi:hypothetical protein